ncbi:bifunctional metallophosphatase/5'-nucleotidase [Ciceribacter selenitireducens]|uniref:Uncharacterized protein n=1 Tax=Ciceribacter selenitireducens ATCC BAA-1503 TaxID=1336235 RepID=A0A376AE34_9HYPH|nr:5'-nucleotidase C-terminal domain-containing protein [Ciceribacter selenitireducens]SSC66109.1 unnamed protein product [Ciceribacter selenitireducens ATCC BAA-1503]
MPERNKLTIVQLNDVHGYLEPHPELVWGHSGPLFPILGGFARIAGALRRIRVETGGNLLTLDNGDMFHGTYPAVVSKGYGIVPAANALGIDAMTAHWEFAWGPDHFEKLAAKLNYPVLALNCYRTNDGTRPFLPSAIFNRGGVTVGVIGMAATIIDKSMPPSFSVGRRFDIDEVALSMEIQRLRNEEVCQVIVVLSHLGLPQDAKLAEAVDGIDVILSGHTHNRLRTAILVRETIIIQSGCHGSFLGRLDLVIGERGILSFDHMLIPIDDRFQADEAMQQIVDDIMRPHRSELGRQVGVTLIPLHRNLQLYSPMDDLLLHAIAMAAGTDVAFSNGWRYGAPIPAGPVTVNDLWNIIPTNPSVSVTDLLGADIRQMMEENLERTFSPDPYRQMGGYLKRFRGLTMFGKLENPAGHRIEHIFFKGRELEDDEEIAVSFVTAQGVPEKYGHARRDLSIRAIEALEACLAAGGAASPDDVGRFYVS